MNPPSDGSTPSPAAPFALPLASGAALFQAVFEQSGVGMVVTDPETGRFLRVNQRYCDILGYSEAELMSLTFPQITHPEDRDQDWNQYRRLVSGELPHYTVEKRYLRKDGRTVWVRVICILARDVHGSALYEVAVIEDVTERRLRETALRESEAHFRQVADFAPVMLWTTDPEGACTYLNAQWYEFTGTTEKQGLGFGWLDSTHPDDRDFAGLVFRDANARRIPFRIEYRLRHRDGQYRWAIDTGTPRFGPDRAFLGYVGSVVDITERLEAEQEVLRLNRDLQRRVTELQTLIDVLPVGIGIAEDPECRRITTNPAFAQMLALSPQDNASLSAPEEERPTGFQVLQDGRALLPEELPLQVAATQGKPVREMEVELVHIDGTRRTMLEYAAPLFDEAGAPRGSVGVFLDITRLKEVEATLREMDRRKDEFLAMLGHELRNPLATIMSAAHVLAELPPGDPSAARLHARITHQGRHLSRLVDDLLDVTRIQEGKIELRPEPVVLSAVVARSVEAVQEMVQQRRHHLFVSLPEAPATLVADPARLEQILTNLLSNAAKYTEPGGEIRLTAAIEPDTLRLAVADTGVGIRPEHLPNLFQLFAQTEHTLDRSAGGLGIGLHLVRTLVELHGGTVAVHSSGPGQGSEFTVSLPLRNDEREPMNDESPNPELHTRQSSEGPIDPASFTPHPSRVLIVDDNRDAAETLCELVGLWGFHGEVRFSGAEALPMVGAAPQPPDIVILDIGMPEMDGYEVARRLRGALGFRGPLIALSGYGQEEDRRRSREAGFDVHLTKPVDPEALRTLLQNTHW